MFDPPIYITVRDRVTPLRRLVSWLEKAGHQKIILLDNGTTWEPCLEYLTSTPHQVRWLTINYGARCAWQFEHKDWFVVTDPDVVPMDECPFNAVSYFKDLLERYPLFPKAGFGLYLGDVPAYMSSLGHEKQLMQNEIAPGVFNSAIDTTFALYRPGSQFDYRALRTGLPYMARHECPSWYHTMLTEEDKHYLKHARKDASGSSWAQRQAA